MRPTSSRQFAETSRTSVACGAVRVASRAKGDAMEPSSVVSGGLDGGIL